MDLFELGYSGLVVNGPDEGPMAQPPLQSCRSREQRPAIVEVLESEVKRDCRMLVASLCRQAAAFGPDRIEARNAFDEVQLRVFTVASVQDRFARPAGLRHVSFASYLRQVCDDLSGTLGAPGGPTLTCAASKIMLPTRIAIWLGLVAGEMIVLAFEQSFTRGHGGRIHVGFSATQAAWELTVEDSGTLMPSDDSRRAACLAVICAMVDRLDGWLDVAPVIGGNRLTVTIPK